MSNEAFFLGFVAIALTGGITLCVWKVSSCLKTILDSTNRSVERERRDYVQFIERLIEKRDIPADRVAELAALHIQERASRVQMDSQTEIKTNTKSSAPKERKIPEKEDLVNTDPAAAAY